VIFIIVQLAMKFFLFVYYHYLVCLRLLLIVWSDFIRLYLPSLFLWRLSCFVNMIMNVATMTHTWKLWQNY